MHLRYFFIVVLSSCLSLSGQTIKTQLVSISAVGDIMMGSTFPFRTLPPKDGKDLFKYVTPYLKADICFGNIEGVFSDGYSIPRECKDSLNCYRFRMPVRYIQHLSDAGFNLVNIANNHSNDFGAGARDSMTWLLKKAGIHVAGTRKHQTCIFTIDNVRYGFCGFSHNSHTPNINYIARAKQIVSQLDSVCDIVIVSFHGGAEGLRHCRVTREEETYLDEKRGNVHKFAHAVIDAGADVVIGHGPHVVRAVELYKGRFIAYSLGNFCTSGRISIKGKNGYAPILKIWTDREGKFVKGHIFSARQWDRTGPQMDEQHRAAGEIKRLTRIDFPESGLYISDEGEIHLQ